MTIETAPNHQEELPVDWEKAMRIAEVIRAITARSLQCTVSIGNTQNPDIKPAQSGQASWQY